MACARFLHVGRLGDATTLNPSSLHVQTDEDMLATLAEALPHLTSLTHLDLFRCLRWLQLQSVANALLDSPAREAALQLTYSSEITSDPDGQEAEGPLLELTARLAAEKNITLHAERP